MIFEIPASGVSGQKANQRPEQNFCRARRQPAGVLRLVLQKSHSKFNL
jgi:hypothetical protein